VLFGDRASFAGCLVLFGEREFRERLRRANRAEWRIVSIPKRSGFLEGVWTALSRMNLSP
jgi:hypothetical protein